MSHISWSQNSNPTLWLYLLCFGGREIAAIFYPKCIWLLNLFELIDRASDGATFHELLLLTKRGWQCAVRNMQPLQRLSEITLRAEEVDKNAWRTSFCSLSVCENGFHFQLTTNCLNIFLLNITSVSHQEISYTLNIAESCAFDIIKRLVFKFKVVQSNRILSLGRKWHQ